MGWLFVALIDEGVRVLEHRNHEEAGRLGGRGKKAVDIVNSFTVKGGNKADYLTARIKRDRSSNKMNKKWMVLSTMCV